MSVTGADLLGEAPPYDESRCSACQGGKRCEECWKFTHPGTVCVCYGASDERIQFHNVLRTRMLLERLLQHLGVIV